MNLDKGIIEDIGDYTIYVDNTKTIKWGKVGLVDIEYKDKTLYMSDWIESDEELNYKIEKAIEKVNFGYGGTDFRHTHIFCIETKRIPVLKYNHGEPPNPKRRQPENNQRR